MTPDPSSPPSTLRALWPWLPLWLAVALVAIFSHGPVPLFSTRTLAVAWEMWNHGQWLVPHLNGQPYSEKAPLLFWLIHAGWFAFGVSDIWPRLLEVGFGAIELVLLMQLARRLFPEQPWVARAAPWMLMALIYAFLFCLQIMYDALLAACVLGALLCLTEKPGRAEPRWLLFGVCIGLGLLTKGPVMLLHVAFPWLLGPLWNGWARQHRARWYGRGLLAVLLGLLMLAAWLVPAVIVGGPEYRHRILFTQTAARVVDGVQHAMPLQAHSRPWWWYFSRLPLVLLPFFFWPRAWVAVARLRRPLNTGLRFALCWLLPMLLVLSLISGKQAYYPLPEFAGSMLLIAGAIAALRERHPRLAGNAWLGTWPLAIGGLILAGLLFALPVLVGHAIVSNPWAIAMASGSPWFGAAFALLGACLFLRGRREVLRLSIAGLIGALLINTMFTLTWWPRYDLGPTTRVLAQADRQNRPIAFVGNYNGQFHFAARLAHPIHEIFTTEAIVQFAQANPNGLIITDPETPDPRAQKHALVVQPFRSDWNVTWSAPVLAALRSGKPLPPASGTPRPPR